MRSFNHASHHCGHNFSPTIAIYTVQSIQYSCLAIVNCFQWWTKQLNVHKNNILFATHNLTSFWVDCDGKLGNTHAEQLMAYIRNCNWVKAVGMERREFADCLFKGGIPQWWEKYSKLHCLHSRWEGLCCQWAWHDSLLAAPLSCTTTFCQQIEWMRLCTCSQKPFLSSTHCTAYLDCKSQAF